MLGLYPTVLTTIEAFFTNNALLPGDHSAGLQNFQALFDNPNVRESLFNTGWYVLFGTVITVVLGTGIALLLQ
jgi:ABC-type sugar transport system permease subunit